MFWLAKCGQGSFVYIIGDYKFKITMKQVNELEYNSTISSRVKEFYLY